MNIRQAKEEIINTVKIYTSKNEAGVYKIPAVHQRPVLLIGPPGIGKTAIIRQAADACGVGLVAYTITHHTRQSAVGLPVVMEKTYQGKKVQVTEYTMSEIIASVYECIEETGHKEGILFIDEINCVSETLAPTMLQFLQNKTFGTHKVPDGWIIVAAGNPAEYNKSAKMFDVVTMDRVKYIPVDIDFGVWKDYALEKGIHNAIVSYLSAKPQNFYYIEEARGDREFVTARGWEDLSVLLYAYENEKIPVTDEVLAEYLHCRKTALDFAAYYTMFTSFQKEYRIADIIEGKASDEDLDKQQKLLEKAGPDESYSIIQLCLSYLYERFGKYASESACDQRMAEIYSNLKDFQKRNKDLDAERMLNEYAAGLEKALDVRREHHIISEETIRIEEQTTAGFGNCIYRIKNERITDPETAVKRIGDYMEEELAEREKLAAGIDAELCRAFEFLEGALKGGEKLGYFVTALSVNGDAAAFLNAHPNSAYGRNIYLIEHEKEEERLKKRISAALNR